MLLGVYGTKLHLVKKFDIEYESVTKRLKYHGPELVHKPILLVSYSNEVVGEVFD